MERGIQSKGERVLNARLHLSADADDTDLTRREPRATETLTLAAHNTGGTHHAALFSLPITSDSPKAEDTGKMHTGGKHLEKRGGVAGKQPEGTCGHRGDSSHTCTWPCWAPSSSIAPERESLMSTVDCQPNFEN